MALNDSHALGFSTSLKKLIEQLYGIQNENNTYLNVIEFGCGINPAVREFSFHDYLGVDINLGSPSYNQNNFPEHEFISADISSSIELNKKYDLAIDSHLLHCLTKLEDRKQYYNNIKSILAENGSFVAEVICYDKSVKFPFDYSFDGEIIYKTSHEIEDQYLIGGVFPYRWLADPRDVEAELLAMGFKIDFFMIRTDLRLELFPNDKFPVNNWPYLCQFQASLNLDL
jgi:SAM-dependent methyltransferase